MRAQLVRLQVLACSSPRAQAGVDRFATAGCAQQRDADAGAAAGGGCGLAGVLARLRCSGGDKTRAIRLLRPRCRAARAVG
jgi:hypothetical protein